MPRLLLLTLAALLLLPSQSATTQTGEPPRQPILCIETGMHIARINGIGTDAANKFLVTASNDKTLRVWALPEGKLLRVLRVPVGPDNEGKLYAVTISPDGGTVATGGWTAAAGGTENIYLFDRSSGRLLRRISGLPARVNHLVFSPDGRYLAAALGQGGGVRVYHTSQYILVGEDRDYGARSDGADFDATGKLATTSFDGFIRLYRVGEAAAGGAGLRLLAKQRAPDGALPYGIKISPDGSRVAVGFLSPIRVSVLSGRDLSLLFAPDTSGVSNGDLAKVVWSTDGGRLYAGGRAAGADNGTIIREWADGGRGQHRDINTHATDTIMQILALRNGGVLYGTLDPAFGLLDTGGRRALVSASNIAKYPLSGFLLSQDGATVQFAYDSSGDSAAVFSLAARRIVNAPAPGATGQADLRAARTAADGIVVTDWTNGELPKLNGSGLGLVPFEISRSLAISPDASVFLLGTDFTLRLYNRAGRQLWRVAGPATAWAVNISGDGRLVAAAYADGTIRWYRMTDGKELLAFFPHADRKRWVLWTPAGYYDASPGAEELIGWHVNNGRDRAADFFPVGQFRGVYYRPDVVSKILQAGDEQLALREANEEAGRKAQQSEIARLLPPVVEIVSPADGAEVAANEVTVRFSLRTPSGEPVTEVRALVDGRPAAAERNLSVQAANDAGAQRELRVAVPAGESQVSVIASNRFTTSVPATIRVRAQVPAPKKAASGSFLGGLVGGPKGSVLGAGTDDAFEIRPKLYVLAVGVSSYADPKLNLSFAAKDARDFVASWERQKGALYRDVVVKTLTDAQATKDEILDGLDWLRRETTSKDVAVVLFAGHGVNDQNGQYYFLPHNADTERLLRTGVSFSDIRSVVSSLAGKTLFFIDTCHSGNVLGTTRRGLWNDLNGVVNELASAENGAVVFAASTGRQYSQEKVEWNNGAFTLAVVEGLGGRADFMGKGRITINMLDLYISERVKELTRGQQTPTTAKPNTVPDFPVALKK